MLVSIVVSKPTEVVHTSLLPPIVPQRVRVFDPVLIGREIFVLPRRNTWRYYWFCEGEYIITIGEHTHNVRARPLFDSTLICSISICCKISKDVVRPTDDI